MLEVERYLHVVGKDIEEIKMSQEEIQNGKYQNLRAQDTMEIPPRNYSSELKA